MPNLSVPLSLIPRGIRVVQPERCLSSCDVGDSGFKARDFALEDLVLRRSGSVEILAIFRTFCTNTLIAGRTLPVATLLTVRLLAFMRSRSLDGARRIPSCAACD